MPALSSPEHHVVFSQLLEEFFRKGAAPLITPMIAAELKQAGLDLSKKLDPAYPARVMDDVLEIIAVRGLPHLSRADALREVGRMQIRAFSETFLGRATLPVFKVVARDRERALKLLTRGFRQANNYVEARHEKLGEGHFRVWINDVGRNAELFEGMLEAGNAMLGLRVTVSVAEREGLACWYELRDAS